MANTKYTLSIQVLHQGKEKALRYLIEAWDWDEDGKDDFLGEGMRDGGGYWEGCDH